MTPPSLKAIIDIFQYFIVALLAVAPLHAAEAAPASPLPWAVYYGEKLDAAPFAPYRLVVLDAASEAPIKALMDENKEVLGYVSLGEAGEHHSHREELKAMGLLAGENPNWPGSHTIDIRDPRWGKMVLEELIPHLLHKGFRGLFYDTLDSPLDLERREPEKYKGMREAAVRLVKAIRAHYPEVKIMQNRGYEILQDVAGDIDYALGESMRSDYDFAKKAYFRVPEEEYRQQAEWLNQAKAKNPALAVMTLDYWDPADPAGLAAIYREQRERGFNPYVATIQLDRLVKEPQ